MSNEVNNGVNQSKRAEEYYIHLLSEYGQDENDYKALEWQNEEELPSEFITYIYSDAFLEMLNGDIADWYEDLRKNIKASIAYGLFKERTEKFFTKEWIFDNLVDINSHIVEVYEYQKRQCKNMEKLKQTAALLKEGCGEKEGMQPSCLDEVNKLLDELNASYRSLQKQLGEIYRMKKKVGYLVKKPLYRMGILEEDHKEEVLKNQIQVLEKKINSAQRIKDELQPKYDAVAAAIEKLQKEILTPQTIGELTNIQQQLPLTNEAILKQIARPLLRKINQICGMPVPKGSYCFKLYIEVCILYAFKGPAGEDEIMHQ